MHCSVFCFIGIVFVIAHLNMIFNVDKTKQKEDFYKTLTSELINKYENIIKERRNISVSGYFLGLILALVFLNFSNNLNIYSSAFFTAGITFLTNYLYYIIIPKSDYMIIHLDKKEQRIKWKNIYRSMQLKYHIGILFGVIGAGFFGIFTAHKKIC